MCQATGTPPHLKYEADGGPGIDAILTLLGGSEQRDRDCETFFRAQLLFWLLCAPDGHAKNFSIVLHASGSFSLAPLYDVMSAYPLLGEGPGRLSPHRVRMAMAVRAKNAHWRMRNILRQHWEDLGRRHGIVNADGRGIDAFVEDVAERTPAVIESIRMAMPTAFPERVAVGVSDGLRDAVNRSANQTRR